MKRVLLPLLIFVVFVGFVLYRINLVDRTPPREREPGPTYENIVLYVDESISMRGYFRVMPQEGTPVQRFLWNNIMVLLNSSFPGDTVYCSTFGSEINVPGKRSSLLDRYHFNSAEELNDTFSYNKTELVELFNGDYLRNYRAFIVITDGIPSSGERTGPDPALVYAIENLHNNDSMYIWVIGVLSEFHGMVYPQCPNKQGVIQRFPYRGRRPIYLWIGSREVETGLEMTGQFLKEFFTLMGPEAEDLVKVAEITHIDRPKATLRMLTEGNKKLLAFWKNDHLDLTFARGLRERVEIPIDIVWQDEKISHRRQISFGLEPESMRDIEVIWDGSEWLLGIDDPGSSVSFAIKMLVTIEMPRWWIDWSTSDDSDPTSGRRTLFLKPLIDHFIRDEQPYQAAELKVVVK